MIRKYTPKNIRLIPKDAKKVFTGEIYEVFQWPQKLYDGSTATFEMLRRADTVKVMAIVTPAELQRLGLGNSNEPELIITNQQQPGKGWFYDYPGGRTDEEDVNELAAAKREMLEETGLEFKNWKLVEVHQPFNKIDWLVYTFVASGLMAQHEQKLDAGEKIKVETASLKQIQEYAESEDSKFLRFKHFDKVRKIEDLEKLPELCKY